MGNCLTRYLPRLRPLPLVNMYFYHPYISICAFYVRMIDALTPSLSTLHPMSIVNSMYLGCTSSVEKQNFLKKSRFSHPDKLKALLHGNNGNSSSSLQTSNKYSETTTSVTQAFITIPQVHDFMYAHLAMYL